ncbi:protein of unknown function DUF296 [Alkalidesulfovibrio alkalitolerans DSM 16529]|jgi:predicted DNA-binding protein with PD1-like motif|uniref:PPC domain-containing protein n=1 Tax=Alkalidesulfovibrio alkalitolerans DSM 16529 TaxID=1121439 RepID=S7T3G5_9BACT|nr:PPC domain-containing DNA-binding protein [Alkalidesulfovibrio alkalitolerans]EPR31632.1 protein of unknown function DUF296 [Alkalidesulfovibrio alkalitolerans DSM 16529]
MRVSEGSIGRIFVIRLEDGDKLPDSLEEFAREKNLSSGLCLLLGGAGDGTLVTGPVDGEAKKIIPILHALGEVHELAAVGTIFPDAQGAPRLHMHGSFGRGNTARVGCVRRGVDIWRLAECVVVEILGTNMRRVVDPAFGFEVLSPE